MASTFKQEDIHFVEEAQDEVRDRIIEGLNEFNRQNGFEYRREPFSISYCPSQGVAVQEGAQENGGAKGAILAGLTGHTSLGQLYIELLWVDKSLRGQGVGKALMDAAESFAHKKGCKGMYVDTFSFQAQPFYEKSGFKFLYEIEGCANPGSLGSMRRIFLGKVF